MENCAQAACLPIAERLVGVSAGVVRCLRHRRRKLPRIAGVSRNTGIA